MAQASASAPEEPRPLISPTSASAKAVNLLKELGLEAVSETDAKRLFDVYADVPAAGAAEGEKALSRVAVYRLLLDLQVALGRNPVVTEPAVEAVLGELVLHVESSDQLTWVEFKSFFVYLNQTPLQRLGELVEQIVPDASLAFCCVVTFPQPPQSNGLVDRVQGQLKKLGAKASTVFAAFPPEGIAATPEVLVAFSSSQLAAALVGKHVEVDGITGTAALYQSGSRFPSFIPVRGGDPSRVAGVLASGVILGKQAASKAKQFDEKHKISETVVTKAQEIDSKFKVTETAKATADKAKQAATQFDEKHQISKRASAKAQEIDEKYAVRQKVADTKSKVMGNPTVKKGLGFLSSVVNKATSAAQDLAGETMDVVASRESGSGSAAAAAAEPDAAASAEGAASAAH